MGHFRDAVSAEYMRTVMQFEVFAERIFRYHSQAIGFQIFSIICLCSIRYKLQVAFYELVCIPDTVRYGGVCPESEIFMPDSLGFIMRRYRTLDGHAGIFGNAENDVLQLPVFVEYKCKGRIPYP